MNAYFLDHIRSRRADPGSDLTSKLIQAEVDGERLADEEIIGFVGLLLLAGHITTTATLGNSVVCFQDNPDAAAEVRADPTLLPAAIEEVLRLRTPFPRVGRLTKVDTEVGGVPIPAGQIVLPWLAAANRDERVFAEPAPVRPPPQAQPAPDLRARHPLLPRRAARPAGGQGRAAAAAAALPGHRGGRRRAGRAPQPVDDGGRRPAAGAGQGDASRCARPRGAAGRSRRPAGRRTCPTARRAAARPGSPATRSAVRSTVTPVRVRGKASRGVPGGSFCARST